MLSYAFMKLWYEFVPYSVRVFPSQESSYRSMVYFIQDLLQLFPLK